MIRRTVISLLFVFAASGAYAIRPSEPEASLLRGQELFSRGRWSDARHEFVKVRDMIPSSGLGLRETADYHIAMCGLQLDRPDAERGAYLFMETYPASMHENDLRFALALYYCMREDFDAALREFDAVDYLLLDAADRERYDFRVGYIEFLHDSYDDAYDLFSRIERDSEYYDSALYYRAYIEYSRGNYAVAKQMFGQLLESESYAELAPYYLLQIEYKEGNYPYVVKNGSILAEKSSSAQRIELQRLMAEAYFRMNNYRKAAETMQEYAASGGVMEREENYILGYSLYRTAVYNAASDALQLVCGPDDALTRNASYHLADCYLKLGDKRRAADAFAMAVGDNADDSIAEDALFNYGKLKYELGGGTFNEAINVLTRYIDRYPDTARTSEARELLVAAYFNSDNYEGAYNAIKAIPDPDSNIRAALQKITYFRGLESYSHGDIDRAESLLQESVSVGISPKYGALGLFWLGEIAYGKGDSRRAEEYYRKYLDRAPKSEREYKMALYNLGYACLAQDDITAARRSFSSFLSVYKNADRYYADALNRRGDTEYAGRDYSAAAESYARAARVESVERYYAQYQRAIVLGLLGRTPQKTEALKSIIAADRGDYVDDAAYELGRTYLVQEKYSEGAAALEPFVEKYPGSPYHTQALLDLGLAYFNMGERQRSLSCYERVVAKDPQTSEARDALRGIREIYVDSGNVDGYFDYAAAAGVECDTSNMMRDSLTFESARKIYMTGDAASAVAPLEKYVSGFPKGYYMDDALYYLSDCYIKNGDNGKAVSSLEMLAGRPSGKYAVATLSHLGRIAFAEGQYDTAAKAYRRLYDAETAPQAKADAMTGYVRSVVACGDDDAVLAAADDVLSHADAGAVACREAAFVKAGILKKRGDNAAATELYRTLGKDVKSAEGAQSAYEVIASEYAAGHFDEAENLIYAFADANTPYAYWLGKSFLLLGDIYRARNDLFQARATYQSIVDGYSVPTDGLIDEARERIRNIN